MFSPENLTISLIIAIARICDVSLGTIRQVMVIKGRRQYAFLIAFFESMIWVYAVSSVIQHLSNPLNAIAFAFGYASGTFVGMTLEELLKIGEQVVRIFSKNGVAIANQLRDLGYRVTIFDGNGRDGAVNLLFVQVKRRHANKITKISREIDPSSFIVMDDIRNVSSSSPVRK